MPYPYGINNSTEEEDGSSEGKEAYTYDVRIGKVSKYAIRGGYKEEHLSDDIICECPHKELRQTRRRIRNAEGNP